MVSGSLALPIYIATVIMNKQGSGSKRENNHLSIRLLRALEWLAGLYDRLAISRIGEEQANSGTDERMDV